MSENIMTLLQNLKDDNQREHQQIIEHQKITNGRIRSLEKIKYLFFGMVVWGVATGTLPEQIINFLKSI